VCGSTAASSLMAALAVGAGSLSGGREVFFSMQGWQNCGTNLDAWRTWLSQTRTVSSDVWPEPDHVPGFDPHGISTATPIRKTLDCLARLSSGGKVAWLRENLAALEALSGYPLALSGIAAAALTDLGFEPEQGEMLHLLLRLPGAAAHALEQRPLGYKRFPFGVVELEESLPKEAI